MLILQVYDILTKEHYYFRCLGSRITLGYSYFMCIDVNGPHKHSVPPPALFQGSPYSVPLGVASQNGYAEIAESLIVQKADVNYQDEVASIHVYNIYLYELLNRHHNYLYSSYYLH